MDRLKAIYNTHSNAVRTNDEGAWDKDDKLISLDESAITAEMNRLQVEWEANVYAEKRRREYPSVQECVHAILDDTLDALQAKRASIKTKYPKGG